MLDFWRKCYISDRVIDQNVNFNMTTATILVFVGHGSVGQNCSESSFSVTVSNLVRIRSNMVELWPFNCFQNGGGVYFYHLVVLA